MSIILNSNLALMSGGREGFSPEQVASNFNTYKDIRLQ